MVVVFLLLIYGWGISGKLKNRRASKKKLRRVHRDLANTTYLHPLKDEPPIMFWRLQKVGSSSLVGLLVSYAFRFNILLRHPCGNLCSKLSSCLPIHQIDSLGKQKYLDHIRSDFKRYAANKGAIRLFDAIESHPYSISASHQICAVSPKTIQDNLACTFFTSQSTRMYNSTKELFLLRDPLSRAISAYYFWGELYKLSNYSKQLDQEESMQMEEAAEIQELLDAKASTKQKKGKLQLGMVANFTVHGKFTYHGNEFTAPPLDIAKAYAKHFPYHIGMPGTMLVKYLLYLNHIRI